MSDGLLNHPAVMRVQEALLTGGSNARIVALETTARSAEDAANSIGCALGAIVKSLVFRVDGQVVLALVAGDRRCDVKALARALGTSGKAHRADADMVRATTGFSIGGVAPIGHLETLPTVIDSSLGRFDEIFAAAGHPHCVFPTTLDELLALTKATLSDDVGC